MEYEKMYRKMFNAATDAERLIQQALLLLQSTQLECEEIFVEAHDPPAD